MLSLLLKLQQLLGGTKVDSVFHPFEVNWRSSRNPWGLSGKSKLSPCKISSLETGECHQLKDAIKGSSVQQKLDIVKQK